MAVTINKRTQAAAVKLLKFFGPNGEKWAHGYFGLDADDQDVEPKHRNAVKWCLSGAFQKLNISDSTRESFDHSLGPKFGDITDFNDSKHTYTHVRKFLEKLAKGKVAK